MIRNVGDAVDYAMKGFILFCVYAMGIGVPVAIMLSIPAWITHVIYCLNEGMAGFLIAGAILFPIGIIHGFMIWVGALF